MSRRVFITFANTNFMKPDRIVQQAREFGVFDEVNIYLGDRQYHHQRFDYKGDWSSLDAYPIQCRRLAPREPRTETPKDQRRALNFLRRPKS